MVIKMPEVSELQNMNLLRRMQQVLGGLVRISYSAFSLNQNATERRDSPVAPDRMS